MPKVRLIPPAERLGLSRVEAAEYIGVSPALFDEMVLDAQMPQPKLVNSRKLWMRTNLEKAFAELPEEGQDNNCGNPWRDFA
jgi:hypothetical protein